MIVPAGELIPVIADAVARGQTVRMTVSGHSMRPFIRNGETVDIEPPVGTLEVGDVVLAETPK